MKPEIHLNCYIENFKKVTNKINFLEKYLDQIKIFILT